MKIQATPDLYIAELATPVGLWLRLGNRPEVVDALQEQILRILNFHLFLKNLPVLPRDQVYFEAESREHGVIHIHVEVTTSSEDHWIEVDRDGRVYFL